MLPAQLLEWNQTEVDCPRSSTIADLFEQQAVRTPDLTALVANTCRLSYRDLDERSNRLARHLQGLGVGPDTLIGVAMGRTETLVIGMLAILKAGGAYVPLDPNFPKERLSLVIEDSEMQLILTTAKSRPRIPPPLPSARAGVTILDAEDPSIAAESAAPVPSAAVPANIAYVIYTSGSTGKPKGVIVENRNVVNFFTGMDLAVGCEPGVWLAVTSVSFDISVLELLWTLTRGFTVVLHDEEGTISIADEITREGVTNLQMTPSLARMLTLDPRAFAALGSLRQMLLGGEAVPAALIHHLRQVFRGEIHNMYGPTETTIWSTSGRIEDVGTLVSIGKPIANTQIYMVDAQLNSVPIGEVGELLIGGDGVARGYWNRPELTAEKFVTLPALSSQRIYRTGDLARFLPDGNIEFLGRADFQVKLRGHRIEPSEIEALLEKCPGIRQAVIVVREDREGDKRLVAYLVSDSSPVLKGQDRGTHAVRGSRAVNDPESALKGHDFSRALNDTKKEGALAPEGPPSASLRTTLAAQLPDYMVPSAFVFIDTMPLTDNGKIDRKALLKLPAPAIVAASHQPGDEPTSDTERIVARVWQEALGIPVVGMSENFFDLGAHSLTVAEAHAKLQEALGREIALLDLFQFSTVSSLAAHLGGSHTQNQVSDRAARRRMARQS